MTISNLGQPARVYPTVLAPLEIGNIRLPNRIVFPAFQMNYAHTDGTVSDKLQNFYSALAAGGCGLIFTGAAVVSSDSVAFDRVMRIDSDRAIPGLKKLFANLSSLGSVPGIQLIHYGRQTLNAATGCDLLAPSPIPCPVMSKFDPEYRLLEMSLGDIERVRNDFIRAASRAAEAGAKVIEVHAAHGYLLSEFLSPYSNHRTDAYGDSPENRVRLIREIVEGIRDRLGKQIALSVRVSGHEFVDGGLKPADFEPLIPILERAGMDLLNVSAGVYGSMERIVPPKSLGKIPHLEIASTLKRVANVPVCAVGSIFSLDAAESILVAGRADLTAMGRAQVADPALVHKTATGRNEEIRRCTHCNKCTYWTTGDSQMFCGVNPALKKEKE